MQIPIGKGNETFLHERAKAVNSFPWYDFLTQWSQKVLEQPWAQKELPLEVLASRWLGYPGATETELIKAETRLGVRLPPSYRAFLTVSNGWRLFSSFIPRLWSTQDIEWLAKRRLESITAWRQGEGYTDKPFPAVFPSPILALALDESHFVYGERQDPTSMNSEYLFTALEISDQERSGTALLLLNPRVRSVEGEWEAWEWAHWFPGAYRYRSFLELMLHEYETSAPYYSPYL